MLEHFWWGSVFLLGVPVMVLLLVVGPALLPEFRDPEAGRLDPASAALSLIAVLLVIYGLKQVAQDGPGWLPALSVVAGLATGAVFVARQRALADPLIDLRFFGVPAFGAALATNTLSIFAAFGAFLFIAQYLQLVLGLSPWQAGLWTLPSSGGFVVGSLLPPLMVRWVRPGVVVAAGLALAAVGFALLTRLDGDSGFALFVAGTVIMAVGVAAAITLGTDLIVATAPPERAGAASAISETGAEFGGALGIAVLGSIGTAVYRGAMADAVPAGVPPDVTETARNTLGGAVAIAERLPAPLGTELLFAARAAFAQALELTAAISAVVMLATAVVAVVLLRPVGAVSEAEQRSDPEPDGADAGSAPGRQTRQTGGSRCSSTTRTP
jgi:DHA2 family multidrug resistance protein-like MFS transporter